MASSLALASSTIAARGSPGPSRAAPNGEVSARRGRCLALGRLGLGDVRPGGQLQQEVVVTQR